MPCIQTRVEQAGVPTCLGSTGACAGAHARARAGRTTRRCRLAAGRVVLSAVSAVSVTAAAPMLRARGVAG